MTALRGVDHLMGEHGFDGVRAVMSDLSQQARHFVGFGEVSVCLGLLYRLSGRIELVVLAVDMIVRKRQGNSSLHTHQDTESDYVSKLSKSISGYATG